MEQQQKDQFIRFTTKRGHTLTIRAISNWLMMDIMTEIGEEPPAPTYSVQTAAGIQVFAHYHDPEYPEKSTLKTAEQKAEWAEYEQAKLKYYNERNRKLLALYINEGLVDPPMPTAEWVERMRRYNLTPPEDPEALVLYYYEREIFGSQTDMVTFMLDIMKAGGDISEERVAAIEASFRRMLSRLNQVGVDDASRRLAIQQESGTGEDSQALGQDTDGVLTDGADGSGDNGGGLSDRDADGGLGAGSSAQEDCEECPQGQAEIKSS